MCATSRIKVEQDFLLHGYCSLVIFSILFLLWQDGDICDYSGVSTLYLRLHYATTPSSCMSLFYLDY